MSTHTPSPPPAQTSGGQPPRRRRWLVRLTAIVAVIVVGVAGFFIWQQQQQGCSKATDPTRSGAVTEYCPAEPYGPFSGGGAMTAGADGNLWYTDSQQKVVRFTLPGGAVTEFGAPSSPNNIAYGALKRGTDGNLWYVANYTLGRISMNGQFKEYDLPKDKGFVATLATGPGNALWVMMGNGTLLKGTIPSDPALAPALAEVAIPANAWGGYMTTGPDGALWIAGQSTFTRITPAGVITQFPLNIPGPAPSCGADCKSVVGMTTGPDGAIWFADGWGHIGRVSPTGAITFKHVADQLMPAPIPMGAGPDGNVWFSLDGSSISRITAAGDVTTFPLPHTGGGISHITEGPDGGIWFTLGFSQPFQPSSRIVRITP